MQSNDEARYRLRLAEGFLGETRQDIDSKRWRSCMDNSQLAVENAAKAVLALLGPVGHTHNPGALL
ncbi:MAG: HEPN domain-containing protein [Dehalococcoidia bacterium]|nr:HEPN domain-containing protein [Dehalococcoidia bacterium]